MRKSSFLPLYVAIAATIFLFASTFYLMRSERTDVENHYRVILFFEQSRSISYDLDKEILRSRAFITKNYDMIVHLTNTLRASCRSLAEFDTWTKSEIQAHCDLIEKKISAVEQFKSRNSVLRNSLRYLPELTAQMTGSAQIEAKDIYSLVQRFSAEPSEELRALVEKRMAKASGRGGNGALRLHTENIVNSVDQRRRLEDLILTKEFNQSIDDLEASYLKKYSKQQNRATITRSLLLFFCALMGGLLLILFHRIQYMKNMLADSNETLEQKVKARTVELEQAIAELGEKQQMLVHSSKMSALGEMAGGVAHEINNPLAVISLRADQLAECINENNAPKELILETVQMIQKTAARIAKIVAGLRTFARDGQSLPMESVRIGDIIEETLSFCQERFRMHGVELRIEKNSALNQRLNCRAVEISQVLLNLLNNSFDAIEKMPEKWIEVAAQYDTTTITVAITDSGKGIPIEVRDKIIQPFFTTKEVGKGTGLGLSISKGIMESHGGTLALDSNCPNTRFVVTLPAALTKEKKAA